jgi:5-methylcytosine-specific restriction protein A
MSKEWWINKQRNKTVLENTKQGKYTNREKHSKFYQSKKWQRVRLFVLSSTGGLCAECLKKGLVVAGNIVDHKIPLAEDWSLRLDPDNLQPLCDSCHSKKTVHEQVDKKRKAAEQLIDDNVNALNEF